METVTIHLESVDSTNTYAKQHASTFASDKITCITAEEQTAGRGRFQRHWISPKSVNLYATFCFHLPAQSLHLTSLGQVMAASVATLLIKEGLQPKIKWPNDVQLQGKKVSGVLCETQFHEKTVHVFLGVGINVNMEIEALKQIDQPATSLKVESGKTWDRKTLLRQLQTQFAHDLARFKKEGFAPFHELFEKLLAYKGETIRCFDGKQTWEGVCHSLNSEGQLKLLMPDGHTRIIIAGDVKNY
ncbi:MAG TPA: biotin--[acetyl-CoA-carboxylase] ligase [Chlamydiales bacterium]